jgi:hypothetical protein
MLIRSEERAMSCSLMKDTASYNCPPYSRYTMFNCTPSPSVVSIVRRGVLVRPTGTVPNRGSQLAVPVPVPCGGG